MKKDSLKWGFGHDGGGPRPITSRMKLKQRQMTAHEEMFEHAFARIEKRQKLLWRSLWLAIPVWGLVAASWVTHVVVTIKAANWIFLAIGGFIFPIGSIHGIGVWFGVW